MRLNLLKCALWCFGMALAFTGLLAYATVSGAHGGSITQRFASGGGSSSPPDATADNRGVSNGGSSGPARGRSAAEVESSPDAYRLAPGPHVVTELEFELHDNSRGKDLPVKAYYPADGGPYPLIVFSHGAGGSRDVAPKLLSHWASYGYVVIAPTHADSVELHRDEGIGGGQDKMTGILRSFATDPQVRMGRIGDIKQIIDAVAPDSVPAKGDSSTGPEPARSAALPELTGKIDPAHVGVGGHSAGAMTTSLIGGARCDIAINGAGGPESADFSDSRVGALLILSGQGITGPGAGFHTGSWDHMTLPAMVMTGSFDNSPKTRQTAASRRHPYEYAPAGDKYLLFIDGALHMSFTGRAAGQEPGVDAYWLERYLGTPDLDTALRDYDQQAIFDYVIMASQAFWDAYLKGDPEAKAWLASDTPANISHGQVEYLRK